MVLKLILSVDCGKAVDLLGGEIIAYVTFHGAFSKARAEAYDNRRRVLKIMMISTLFKLGASTIVIYF